MSVWFTSDTHFSHRLVAGLRGFDDLDAHNEHIIQTWNKYVKPNDVVWHLGDLCMVKPSNIAYVVQRLNGDKRIVLGNHDVAHPTLFRGFVGQTNILYQMGFSWVGTIARVRFSGIDTPVILNHFPYKPYKENEKKGDRYQYLRPVDQGFFLLHGHTHSEEKVTSSQEIHVGWDAWNRPVETSEVMKLIRKA